MKSIKTLVAVATLFAISFGAFAQSISATASTLDSAEAKISAMAEQQGSQYTITSARVGDQVHMTAILNK
ncbi:YdgH/BhsA/McbA-like domain containing protein [uncultured Cedecea sp.]|uniref:YdgH/BhsA/McbA-like domain containing protein n=1 Tax=uncultured Cedecea sp. TaxID=988762 RepID=UPI0026265665|nr:YdgH/BhsA/McbA-like domain containing protein [uncultured Cedecea sp.]